MRYLDVFLSIEFSKMTIDLFVMAISVDSRCYICWGFFFFFLWSDYTDSGSKAIAAVMKSL